MTQTASPALKRTSMIVYNVHARGRSARGVDRNFDTKALARLINGPSVQERVRKGDMLGYYGHWPRIKFGMPTQEGGVLDGKVVSLPTAVRTVHLSADEEGNITHQAEFLDTPAGQIAAKLYDSKAGGFSSAIDPVRGLSPGAATVPAEFHGFDYVLEPNYDSNRGYRGILDAASAVGEGREDAMALLDAVMSESLGAAVHLNTLLDAVMAQQALSLKALEEQESVISRLKGENDLLIGQLAAGRPILDGAAQSYVAPVDHGGGVAGYRRFLTMPLTAVAEPKDDEQSAGTASPETLAAERRFGLARGSL